MICEHCGKNNTGTSDTCKYCGAEMPKLEAGNGFGDVLKFRDGIPAATPQSERDVTPYRKKIRRLRAWLIVTALIACAAILATVVSVGRLYAYSKEAPASPAAPIAVPEETPTDDPITLP